MAQTLPNGVVVPNENGGELISSTGVAEMRTLGASVDTALAGKLEDDDLDPLRAASFNRGVLPANTDTRTYITEAHSGMWHIRSQAAAEGMIGLPDGLQVQGEFLVLAGGPATQMFFPYGFYGAGPQVRHVANVATNELSDWQALGGSGGAGGAGGPWVQNTIRKALFMQEMGGPIDTGGLGAVALRFDHGLLNFRDKVLPLTKARGLKVSQAYNPRNWHYDENAGVTPAQLNTWVADGDVEIWNHSANHLDASDDDALYDTIVNGLTEIEAELPAARGKVWGFNPPGVNQADGYGGFGNGNSPEKWDTPAGRLILQHHAVASAYLPGTSIRPLDGTVRDGQSHITMDSISVAAIKGYIDQAIAQRGGLQLMLHPSQLDQSGKLTTAQLTEVLDYIVTKREAGELVTLSPYELLAADATRTPAPPAWDTLTGKPSTFPPAPHSHAIGDVTGLEARLALLEPQDLGTKHLDTVTARGKHYQPFASRATKAQGYPWEGVAGIQEIEVWNPANGLCIATFKSWDRGIAKRTLHLGTWRPWQDALGNNIS